jgi:carbon starvation protein
MDFFVQTIDGRNLVRATPVLIFALGILAIAYRYYSAFLAARVLCLDDSRLTPAVRLADGQNYHVIVGCSLDIILQPFPGQVR